MAAQPKPFIHSVDESGNVTFTRGGVLQTQHWLNLDKVALITLAKFLGFKFTGSTPLKWSLDEIRTACQSVMTAKQGGQPVPTPTKSVPTPTKEVIMPQPKVEQAIQDLLNAVQCIQNNEVDVSEIRRIAAEVVEPVAETVEEHSAALQGIETWADHKFGELAESIAKVQPKVVHVTIKDRPTKELGGVQHEQFPKVLTALGAGLNIMMVGPAGTGKTTIASNAAKALDLPFSSKSCTSQTTESSLVGFIHAGGDYVTTEFRKRFAEGGVFLLDEVDNANPNVLGVLNSALANGEMAFPDGMVKRHADFVCVAAGNTYGNGATSEYVGRNPIDAATKDRFVFIDVNIDEAVENAMLQSVGLDASLASEWLTIVRKARTNVQTYGLKVIVSPRATEGGARLLRAGWTMRDTVDATLLKGAKPDQTAKILEGVTL